MVQNLPTNLRFVGETPYGAPQIKDVIMLNVNENPNPVDKTVVTEIVAEIESSLRDANRYPDRELLKLRTNLA
ncbi:MAG: histidinol-phosphate transaminase, partial [Bifidobacteriaceae bacterium]|nr:histidinol-phosphate transaminase [Bifidobacteriaceae bacterium]